VLAALEGAISAFDDTNQDFIVHTLQKLLNRLNGLFNRFVDQQIRGIEETKVKINKRKGVISFMRTFPNFSAAVENMLASQSSSNFSDVRLAVNEAYNKVNRAMWESLKFIAKEAPGQTNGATTGVGDPEDKEALNYHILLIENMNHYIEEVDTRGIPVLERWRERAYQDYHEHMKLYMDAVIRRPLGKLLDFVESTESLRANTSNPTDIAARTSHSRQVAKKLMSSYDVKELRRGADLLKKRVEKHFGDADDPGLSRSLVLKVFKECENRYADAYDRTKKIIDTVYDGQVELEWNRDEAGALFRR
jgi:exocyst complex component 1